MEKYNKLEIIREDGVTLILLNGKPCFPRFDIWSTYIMAVLAIALGG